MLEAGSRNLIVSYPNEILHEAVTKMLRYNIGRLPVVERENPTRLIGYLGRAVVMEARLKLHDEEYIREPGFLSKAAKA